MNIAGKIGSLFVKTPVAPGKAVAARSGKLARNAL